MTLELRDIAMYQTWTNPAATRAAGIVGIIAKATESYTYVDPKWNEHRAKMLANGFIPGAYVFSRPDLGDPPDRTAEFFLTVANPGNGWLLAHDAESNGGSLAWCDEFELHCAKLLGGYHVWFYSYWAWMTGRGIVGSPLLSRSPLWGAWPDSNGPIPTPMAMQQYGAGPVPGFSGNVDLNRFFGDASQLTVLTVGGSPPRGNILDVNNPIDRSVYDGVNRLLFSWSGRDQYVIDQQTGKPVKMENQPNFLPDTVAATAGKVDVAIAMLTTLLAAEGVEQAAIAALGARADAAVSLAALSLKLDAVLAGLPVDTAAGIKAELDALSKHLGGGAL